MKKGVDTGFEKFSGDEVESTGSIRCSENGLAYLICGGWSEII
jgi:hypothetical protein